MGQRRTPKQDRGKMHQMRHMQTGLSHPSKGGLRAKKRRRGEFAVYLLFALRRDVSQRGLSAVQVCGEDRLSVEELVK